MRRINIRRRIFVCLVIFFAVFSFVFLRKFGIGDVDVEAANLANFDPGYIMSDYQMSNYKSMTEEEIQSWLTSKNSCSNTDYDLYLRLSTSTNMAKWHFEDGHFICLSEELFGDGEVIGSGETAAHIIWEAAQDFQINPQVLIVLLQKENSLITDTIPNSFDYRTAAGYGCPDTAACSSKYYGFKNQVRNAAALFHEVLSGGWTNYPLGENYVRFSPHCDSGTVVNIRSLATSALYRYTPYQPNAAALAAGYATVPGSSYETCAAYGNRNFYSFFEDWFGGITATSPLSSNYEDMVVPRLLYVKAGSRYINPSTNEVGVRGFSSFEFFNNTNYSDNQLCLAIGKNMNCYLYSDLEEVNISDEGEMAVPRMLLTKKNTKYFDLKNNVLVGSINTNESLIFDRKVSVNNELCLIIKGTVGNECVLYPDLKELTEVKYSNMVVPRNFYIADGTSIIETNTGISTVINGSEKKYFEKLTYWFNELCLKYDENRCILYDDLKEVNVVEFKKMVVPRFLMIANDGAYVDVEIGVDTNKTIKSGDVLFFDSLTYVDGRLCLQSSLNNSLNNECVLYSNLKEIDNFADMSIPRYINVKESAYYYDLKNDELSDEKVSENIAYFTDKIMVGNKLCLRTKNDRDDKNYRCILYDDLSE